MTPCRRASIARQKAREVERAAHIDGPDAIEIRAARCGERADVADARVVHENVERPASKDDRRDFRAARLVRDIEREEFGGPARRDDLRSDVLARGRVAIGHKNMRLGASERGCDGRADAGTGAGDQRRLVFEREH